MPPRDNYPGTPEPKNQNPQPPQPDPPSANPPAAPPGFNSVDEALRYHDQELNNTTKKSGNPGGLRFVLISFLALLILGIGGFAAYDWYTNQDSPEKIFAEMLEKSMDVSTFSQTYTINLTATNPGDESTYESVNNMDFNFSNIERPAMSIDSTSDVSSIDYSGSQQADLVLLGDGSVFFRMYQDDLDRLNEYSLTPEEKEDYIGQWRELEGYFQAEELMQELLFNSFSFTSLNTARNHIIIGNIPEELQAELLMFQEEMGVYVIQNAVYTTLNSQEVIRYDIKIDEDALQEYVDKLPANPGGDGEFSIGVGDIDTYELYVNVSSRLPMRTTFKLSEEMMQSLGVNDSRVTIDYSNFGQQLNIEAPKNEILESSSDFN